MIDLERFIKAHEKSYKNALLEIKQGKKQTHWMWFIFPQIKGLGQSKTAKYYEIKSIEEAKAYLKNNYLKNHLIEISSELLKLKNNNVTQILGTPDDLKLHSSMTLFSIIDKENKIFEGVLNKYYNRKKDEKTIEIIKNNNI